LYRGEGPDYIEGLPLSQLGITHEDQDFTDKLQLLSVSPPVQVEHKYEMVHGKHRVCSNQGRETSLLLQNASG
jgi:hypothetical protein